MHLSRMSLGERGLEREVLELFDRQVEILLPRLQEAEGHAVATLAHTLKGSARGIGAWRVAHAAANVERATGAGVAPAVAALATAIAETRAEIARLLLTH
jgi:hypothetical protein